MMASTPNSAPKPQTPKLSEGRNERVLQPQKLTDIAQSPALSEFSEFINLMGTISERIERNHEEFAGAQHASGTAQGDTTVSVREEMMKSLPSAPVMQGRLQKHIKQEISTLRKEARRVSRTKSTGWAYELTLIMARIRRLTGIARSIVSASLDALKKFYILVFIDRQSLESTTSAPPAR